MTTRSSFDPFPFAGIDSYRVLVVVEAEGRECTALVNDDNRHAMLASLHTLQAKGRAGAVWNVCRCGESSATLAFAVLLESLNDIDTLERLARKHGRDSILLMYRDGSVHDTPLKGVIRYTSSTTVNDERLGLAQWNNVGEQDIMPYLYYVFAGVPGFLSFSKQA